MKWSSYDPHTNAMIEAAFQAGQTEVSLTHGVFAKAGPQGYTISFTSSPMAQTNPVTGQSRQVRRMGALRDNTALFSLLVAIIALSYRFNSEIFSSCPRTSDTSSEKVSLIIVFPQRHMSTPLEK